MNNLLLIDGFIFSITPKIRTNFIQTRYYSVYVNCKSSSQTQVYHSSVE